MKVILTEDIVRNALNESIDEFMLEEGWLGDTWNNLKNNTVAGQWLSKAGNWLNNGVNMFMDIQTNGQWNRQYNSPVRGKGNTVGVFYLEKWINQHYNRLYDIVYGNYYGNRQYFYTPLKNGNTSFRHDWQSNSYTLFNNNLDMWYILKLDYYGRPNTLTLKERDGTEIENKRSENYNRTDGSYEFKFGTQRYNGIIKIFSAEDNTTPEEYIAKYCTPKAFIMATQNTLENGYFKNAVVEYLKEIQKENNNYILHPEQRKKRNYNQLINKFTTDNFISWYNKEYKPTHSKDEDYDYDEYEETEQQPENSQPNNAQPQLAGNAISVQQTQPMGKKDPNWHPTNKVPLFNNNKNSQ